MNDETHTLLRGDTPLLVSVPHAGRELPSEVAADLVERAHAVEDTDWHLDRLYAFAHRELGASLLLPRCSRYVIDLNRPPENTPMYPGANNTELCPTRFFSGDALYREGRAPDDAAVAERLRRWWRPYHEALAGELARLKARHGHALLWDGHSIRSQLPWLFEGRLPDLNLGTADGASCAPGLRRALMDVLEAQRDYSHVTDGRFKGGYITRRYGRPQECVHAVQMEMCFSTYLAEEAPPWTLDETRTARVQAVLRRMMQAMLDWKPDA